MRIPGAMPQHWSDCALHRGPAYWPMPCDCGTVRSDKPPSALCDHSGYSRGERLRMFVQLWRARLSWMRESHASPFRRCRGKLSEVKKLTQ